MEKVKQSGCPKRRNQGTKKQEYYSLNCAFASYLTMYLINGSHFYWTKRIHSLYRLVLQKKCFTVPQNCKTMLNCFIFYNKLSLHIQVSSGENFFKVIIIRNYICSNSDLLSQRKNRGIVNANIVVSFALHIAIPFVLFKII